jgi:hypothetical protein
MMPIRPAQEPVSAKTVLDSHARILAGEQDARDEASINLLLQASASVEARDALHARLASMPGDPYAEAVLIEIACWDPSDYAAGRVAAQEWLIDHTTPALTGYVQAREDFLSERADHAKDLSGAAKFAQLSPLLALLLAAGLLGAALRMLTRVSALRSHAAR